MLQTIFHLLISKGGVIPTQTQVHDWRSYKRLFFGPLAKVSLTYLNSSALFQKLKKTFLLLISKVGVIPSQTIVHDSRCCKSLFACPLQGEVFPTQRQVHDSRSCKSLSPAHHQMVVLPSGWLQMSQTTFLLSISKGKVLPTKTQVHNYRCCKWLYFWSSARGSLTNPNSSAWLQMLQMTFLQPISKG